jgi:hypothetical protein
VRAKSSAAVFALFACLACVSALSRPASAAPFDLTGTDWEGCTEFVQLAEAELGAGRVSVVSKIEMRQLKREDALILIHPTRAIDTDALSAFMRHGGRVVLLDDYGTGDTLLRHFGIERVPAPAHPSEELRNNPSFAIAEPASNHPVVKDVSKVVTNHPTGLRHAELSPVLKIRSADGNDVLLALAGAVGQGRFLAVGDASIVIDSMLRYPGNRAFARALVHYATDDDNWGKRGGNVYIAANDFEIRGRFGESASFWDDLDDARRDAVDSIEQVRRSGMPAGASYVLAVAIGLAVVIWVGSRAGKPHRPIVPRFLRGTPVAIQGGIAGHAAVIGAPGTSRVLAMLELKSALEEGMCALLALDAPPGSDALLLKLAAAGLLPDEDLRALKALLLRLSNVETASLSRQHLPRGDQPGFRAGPGKIRDREVLSVAKTVERLLATARAAAKSSAA